MKHHKIHNNLVKTQLLRLIEPLKKKFHYTDNK